MLIFDALIYFNCLFNFKNIILPQHLRDITSAYADSTHTPRHRESELGALVLLRQRIRGQSSGEHLVHTRAFSHICRCDFCLV